ncbi:hypothetical protein EBU71_18580 [bacterium]|nr:hypothetical protein [Candidatus Elulimicrobium humile]
MATTPKLSPNILVLPSMCSGSNTAVDLVVKYLPTVTKVELFGVGIKKQFQYNKVFLNNNKHNTVYNDEYIGRIRSHIEKACKDAKRTVIFH